MKKIFLCSLASLLCLASAVKAEDLFAEKSSPLHPIYGGFSINHTNVDYCAYTGVKCEGDGWKFFGGYEITPTIAVEGGYYRFFNNRATSGNDVVTVNGTGMALAGVGSMPVAHNTDLFAKAGFMAWEANAKSNNSKVAATDGTDVLLGVGGKYKLNPNWDIRGELEHVGGDLKSNTYSVGTAFSSY